MNYTELQQTIIDDTKAIRYTGSPVQLFISLGEALIGSRLEFYNFLTDLNDANRIVVGEGRYTLPARLKHLRYVRVNGLPLDKVDETTAYVERSASQPLVYCQRASEILIAGIPAPLTTLTIDYMGMPAAFATTPTNTLLDNVPQLYIDAAEFYLYRRAENFDGAQRALDSFGDICRQLNQQMKKLLGGAQPVPTYNTRFRSSY
jgi:hypothetical protein